jgi:preprotein translocase subunit SecA
LKLEVPVEKFAGANLAKARDEVLNAYDRKYRPEMLTTERSLLLEQLDSTWKQHLLTMDHLKSAVAFSGYGQEDPKIVYKREGMKLFDAMWEGINDRVSEGVFRVEDVGDEEAHTALYSGLASAQAVHTQAQSAMQARQATAAAEDQASQSTNAGGGEVKKVETIRNVGAKVGRNDPCPCGSGKKYKNCHMKLEAKR